MVIHDLKYTKQDLIKRLRFDYEHEEDLEITELEARFNLSLQIFKDNKLVSETEEGVLRNEFRTLLRIIDEHY